MKAWPWALAALVLMFAGGLYLGRQHHPVDPELTRKLEAERVIRVAAQARADTIARRVTTDSLAAVQARKRAQVSDHARARADSVAVAYRDSVRVLSGTLIEVTSASGQRDTATVAPAIVARITSADSSAAAATASAEAWRLAEGRARRVADDLTQLLATQETRIASLERSAPLIEKEAYARGRAAGRVQGFVVGALVAGGTLYVGVKFSALSSKQN